MVGETSSVTMRIWRETWVSSVHFPTVSSPWWKHTSHNSSPWSWMMKKNGGKYIIHDQLFHHNLLLVQYMEVKFRAVTDKYFNLGLCRLFKYPIPWKRDPMNRMKCLAGIGKLTRELTLLYLLLEMRKHSRRFCLQS